MKIPSLHLCMGLNNDPQALRPPREGALAAFSFFRTRPITRWSIWSVGPALQEGSHLEVELGGNSKPQITQEPPWGVTQLQLMGIRASWLSFYSYSSPPRITHPNPCIFHKKKNKREPSKIFKNTFWVSLPSISCKMNSDTVIHFPPSFKNKAPRYNSHRQSLHISM